MNPRPYPAVAAALTLAIAATAARASDCAIGAYRGPAGELATLTTPPAGGPGLRYSFPDGRRGLLSTPDAALACDDGRLHARGEAAAWVRLEVRETPVHFHSGPLQLQGLLMEPAGGERPPLVVLVHGSEKTSPMRGVTQWMLAAQGVATLAYDKRGTGGSEGRYTQDFVALAGDAAAAVAEGRRLAGARVGRIGLYGGSQGGWIAPLAALESGADFVEVGFGVVGTAAEQDRWQVDYQLAEAGYGDDILPRVHAITDATAEVARSGFHAGLERVAALRERAKGAPWLAAIDGQYSGQVLRGEIEQAILDSPQVPWLYAGADVIQALRVPQLWAFAADDDVAPSAPSIERLRAIRAQGADIAGIVFPRATHGMYAIDRDPAGRRLPRDRIVEGYWTLLADFAKASVRASYGAGRWLDGAK